MPSCKFTKRGIDALPSPARADQIRWDEDLKGFGLKLTPAGRKVFLVQYRPTGDRRNPRKYTIGEYGSVTPHQARVEAQRVLANRAAGRDPQAEKQTSKRRIRSEQVAGSLPSSSPAMPPRTERGRKRPASYIGRFCPTGARGPWARS